MTGSRYVLGPYITVESRILVLDISSGHRIYIGPGPMFFLPSFKRGDRHRRKALVRTRRVKCTHAYETHVQACRARLACEPRS